MERTGNCGNEWWKGRTSIQIASEQVRQMEGTLRSRTEGVANAGSHTRPHQVPCFFLTLIGKENENEWTMTITNIITKWYIEVHSRFIIPCEPFCTTKKRLFKRCFWFCLVDLLKQVNTCKYYCFWLILMIHNYSLLICKRWNLDNFGRLVSRQKIRVCIGLIEVWKRYPVQDPQCSQSCYRNWVGNDGVEGCLQTKAVQRGGRHQLRSGLASGGSGAFRIGGGIKKIHLQNDARTNGIFWEISTNHYQSVSFIFAHCHSILFSNVSIVACCGSGVLGLMFVVANLQPFARVCLLCGGAQRRVQPGLYAWSHWCVSWMFQTAPWLLLLANVGGMLGQCLPVLHFPMIYAYFQ